MPKIPETDDFIVDLRQKNKQAEKPADLDRFRRPRSSWLDFIKYNNGFLVILVIGIVAFSGLAFASEGVRDNTIGSRQIFAEGVDNTLLLGTDMDGFNMDFTITGIMEDEESYLVTYGYVDMELKEGAWQFVEKQGGRKISKPFRRDLGLYLAEQLSQEEKARIKELKKLQKQELEKGETKIVQVTKYSGLIGKILDASARAFPGYEPVKKIELAAPEVEERIWRRVTGGDDLAEVYNEYVSNHPEEIAELESGPIEDGDATEEMEEEENTGAQADDNGSGESGLEQEKEAGFPAINEESGFSAVENSEEGE